MSRALLLRASHFALRTSAWVLATATVAGGPALAEEAPKPLVRAHAHNDYFHKRPLLDALDCGFCSVEADIHLVDGELLVAHDRDQCKPERTLQALYLDPLRERARRNAGRVYPGGPGFTLLIDIKSDGESTYATLHKVLEGYADIFTEFDGDRVTERAVTAVISGSCPRRTIEAQQYRFAAIDGRPPDLDRNPPVHLYPLISGSWGDLFEWRGRGAMPDEEHKKLLAIVQRAHDQGRRIRFWGLPWSPKVWPVIYEAGVDLINADNLPALERFLLKQGPLEGRRE